MLVTSPHRKSHEKAGVMSDIATNIETDMSPAKHWIFNFS